MLNVRAIMHTFAGEGRAVEIHGGPRAEDRAVTSVAPLPTGADAGEQHPNALAIVPPETARNGDVAVDLILRRAAAARMSCVVVDAGTGVTPLSTKRLAERLRIALWCEPELDTASFRSRVEHLVRDPDSVGAGAIRALSQSLQRPAPDLGELVGRVAAALASPVCLVGSDGSLVAGSPLIPPENLVEALSKPAAAEIALDTDGRRIVLVPAFPLVVDGPRFWLAAPAYLGQDARTNHVTVALRMGAIALSAHLSQSSLTYERDNRTLGSMLRVLQRRGGRLSAAEIEQAIAGGWQLFGWHAAVQVRVDTSIAELPHAAVAYLFTDASRRNGIRMRPVVSGRAIVLWESWPSPPAEGDLEDLERRVGEAVREVERTYAGVRVRGGIGTAHEGPPGIAATIDEARSALAYAESQQGAAIVHRADRIASHRLIEGLLPDSATRETVLELIAPLRRADKGDQLMTTLRAYLDLESNTTETATALRVHRNTVLQRLHRVRELLPVDLDDASARLTVQLALHLAGSSSGDS